MAVGKLNAIVVICHDLGQHLGCYGVPNVRLKNIDGFAESAIRFKNSFCTAPHVYYDPMRCIRTGRWKVIANFEFAPWQETSPDYKSNTKSYVEVAKALSGPDHADFHPAFELYDLQSDPFEQHNLAESPEHRAIRDELIRRLRKWLQDTDDPLLDGPIAQGAYRQRMRVFKEI